MKKSTKIEKMKKASDILSSILQEVASHAKEGVSLLELDNMAEALCVKYDVIPAFKGYEGFPATLCVGVNDVVVHGIPDEYILKNGDIVSLDMGVKYDDVYSDYAKTVIIGEVSKDVRRFVEKVKECCLAGIKQATTGNTVGDIGCAMQKTAEDAGYSVVEEMVGHGIGYELHEDPYIPGFGQKGQGAKLYKGQTIAIEAIINMGSKKITISKKDGWTSTTKDGMLSALFEHTVVVGGEPTILTKW